MVVSPEAGRDAVRAYVSEQASLGLQNVMALIRDDGNAIALLIADLTEVEGGTSPGPAQFSALQVLQHLNGSFGRSLDRLKTLSMGRPWSPSGPGIGPGNIPVDASQSFEEARRQFVDGTRAVLEALAGADPDRGLDITVPHAGFGDFNWLEWAVYSHHIHTHDHVGQMAQIRTSLGKR